jgi:uncharacterized membrane protein YeaQ/YmgE (transglycosylase-associated protein family)
MNILTALLFWLILGGVAGWLAGAVMGANARLGFMSTIVLGIIGALVGGLIFNLLGGAGVTGINLYSILVAVIGSVAVIGVARATRRA